MNELTIIIPTINYTKYLDQAIESCFKIKALPTKIHININCIIDNRFEKSIYWKHPKVFWRYTEKTFSAQRESINDAIKHAEGDWFFILSDDDYILDGFLENINLSSFSTKSLYATRINIIDESNNIIRTNYPYKYNTCDSKEAIYLFLKEYFHNHLSLFVFNKNLIDSEEPFVDTGYPNGYYIDNVFHAKLIARCDKIFFAQDVVFSRRELATQGSSKFYFTKSVNNYFKIIVNELKKEDEIKVTIINYFKTIENFEIELKKFRVTIEWSKLHNKQYKTSLFLKIKFIYFLLFLLKVPFQFKICFLTSKFSNLLPNLITNFYKKNIHAKVCPIKKYL